MEGGRRGTKNEERQGGGVDDEKDDADGAWGGKGEDKGALIASDDNGDGDTIQEAS